MKSKRSCIWQARIRQGATASQPSSRKGQLRSRRFLVQLVALDVEESIPNARDNSQTRSVLPVALAVRRKIPAQTSGDTCICNFTKVRSLPNILRITP